MSQFIMLLVVNALLINGVYFVTGKGEILSFVYVFFRDKTPEWVCKPVCQCRPCMSSLWGSLIFLGIGYRDLSLPLSWWPAYCLALCGMITFFSNFHE